jgi:L-prolyl-PCP dehydrogenase
MWPLIWSVTTLEVRPLSSAASFPFRRIPKGLPVNFSWSEEQLELVQAFEGFAASELGKDLEERDKSSTFSMEEWKKCADFGVLGLCVPEEYGGAGQDPLTAVLALEALGYGCADTGLVFALNAQMWAVQTPLLRFGSDEQKERYLPALVGGDLIGAHAMTEPGTGSDAFALTTSAVKSDAGDYFLSGQKTFVSNGPVADLFLVFATLGRQRGFFGITAFLVDRADEGATVGNAISKMGLRTSPMSELFLDECRVPEERRLGGEGNGAAIFNHSMNWERCCILAGHVGAMRRQVEACVRHANEREQFGKPISSYQSVSHRIVDMHVRLEAARLLLYKGAWSLTHETNARRDAAMAKLYLSEAAVQSSLDALQLHGGYGYCTEYGFEREVRDALGARIYSGTSALQREVIAESIGLGKRSGRAPGR